LPDAIDKDLTDVAEILGEPKSTILRLALRAGLIALRREHVGA
jgi:hypothetical protein